jgi:tetratricopeptide (TPR) repeat protein
MSTTSSPTKRPHSPEMFVPNKAQRTGEGLQSSSRSALSPRNVTISPELPTIPVPVSLISLQQELINLRHEYTQSSQRHTELLNLILSKLGVPSPSTSATRSSTTTPPVLRINWDEVNHQYISGNGQYVYDKCSEIGKEHPDYVQAQSMLGRVCVHQGKWSQAKEHFSQVFAGEHLFPKGSPGYENLQKCRCKYAYCCIQLGKSEDMKSHLDSIPKDSLHYRDAKVLLAAYHLHLEEYAMAKKLVESDPPYSGSYFSLAQLILGLCCLSPYGLTKDHDAPATDNNVQSAARDTGNDEESIDEEELFKTAISHLSQVRENAPEYIKAQYNIGWCEFTRGSTAAIEHFKKVPKGRAQYANAQAYIIQESLKLSSGTTPPFSYQDIKSHQSRGDCDWVIENCRKMDKGHPWFLLAQVYLGSALLSKERNPEALTALLRVDNQIALPTDHHPLFLEIDKLLADMNNALGICYCRAGCLSTAIDYLKKVRVDQELYQVAQKNIGLSYFYLQNYDEAIKVLEPLTSSEVNSNSEVAYLLIGDCYFYKKEYSRAKEHLIRVASLKTDENHPKWPLAQERLKKIEQIGAQQTQNS